MKKGQVATEYLLLIGVAFFVVIPIFYYALTNSSESIRMNEASNFVETIARTANVVYALGPGSQDYIEVTMPGGVESVSFERNEIILKIKIFGDVSDVFAESKANLTGTLLVSDGVRHVYIRALDSGIVEIGEL